MTNEQKGIIALVLAGGVAYFILRGAKPRAVAPPANYVPPSATANNGTNANQPQTVGTTATGVLTGLGGLLGGLGGIVQGAISQGSGQKPAQGSNQPNTGSGSGWDFGVGSSTWGAGFDIRLNQLESNLDSWGDQYTDLSLGNKSPTFDYKAGNYDVPSYEDKLDLYDGELTMPSSLDDL